MKAEEIIRLWKNGLTKHKVAQIYKRRFNQQVKLERSNIKHRYDGRFISSYEALAVVEKILYQYIKKKQ